MTLLLVFLKENLLLIILKWQNKGEAVLIANHLKIEQLIKYSPGVQYQFTGIERKKKTFFLNNQCM